MNILPPITQNPHHRTLKPLSFIPMFGVSAVTLDSIQTKLMELESACNTFYIQKDAFICELREIDVVHLELEVKQLTQKKSKKWRILQKNHKGSDLLEEYFELLSKILGVSQDPCIPLHDRLKQIYPKELGGCLSTKTLSELDKRNRCLSGFLKRPMYWTRKNAPVRVSPKDPSPSCIRFTLVSEERSLKQCCQKVRSVYQKLVYLEKKWRALQIQIMYLALEKTNLQDRLFILGLEIEQEVDSNSRAAKKIQEYFIQIAHFIGIEIPTQNLYELLKEIQKRSREETEKFLSGDYARLL